MANICTNWVEVSGDEEQIKQLVELVGEEFDFNKVIPTEKNSSSEAREKWGCGTIGFDVSFDGDEVDFGHANWTFWTKWCPPTLIYEKLCELFPHIFIYWRYEEPGNGVYGYLNNGDF